MIQGTRSSPQVVYEGTDFSLIQYSSVDDAQQHRWTAVQFGSVQAITLSHEDELVHPSRPFMKALTCHCSGVSVSSTRDTLWRHMVDHAKPRRRRPGSDCQEGYRWLRIRGRGMPNRTGQGYRRLGSKTKNDTRGIDSSTQVVSGQRPRAVQEALIRPRR